MTRWLLAPVKPFSEAKSRLASVLTPAERALLMHSLLERTLAVAQESSLFDSLLVVSRDPRVWEAARRAGAYVLPEQGEDLNSALAQGRHFAAAAGVEQLLILPADLPWLSAADLKGVCALGEQEDGIVLGPAGDGGTNVLHLRLPSDLPFCFGENSFACHMAAARAAGLVPLVYTSPTLRFDLDTPADWATLVSGVHHLVQQL
jgi:2-phospho-L-lactate/phosphoenolpyruvate guanylyltransferase